MNGLKENITGEKKVIKEREISLFKKGIIFLIVILLLVIPIMAYLSHKISDIEVGIENRHLEYTSQISSYADLTLSSINKSIENSFEVRTLLAQQDSETSSINTIYLEQINKIISDPNSLFTGRVEDPINADKAFILASDGKLEEIFRETHYLYAIIHNP